MFYNDHGPPHFHAFYGELEVTIRINDGVADGRFPRRALALVLEWYTLHKEELHDNWKRARSRSRLRPLDPLE